MNAIDRFMAKKAVRQGRTLIVGSKIHEGTDKPDRRKLFDSAVGVDMEAGAGVDRVLDLEEVLPGDIGQFAHVECTSVLEHSRRPWLMAENIERLMREDATLLVLVPWVWRIHQYPGDYFRFTPMAIESLFPSIAWSEPKYIIEDQLLDKPPNLRAEGIRWMARSELIMFGRKCISTS